MKFLYVFCLVSLQVGLLFAEDDFTWEMFNGKIPDNAVPGGKDESGRTTYIGKVTLYNETIEIPGEIDATTKLFYYALRGNPHSTDVNVTILCGKNLVAYQWVKTNLKDVRFLTYKSLILGGFDDDYPLLIGRMPYEGRVAVGKITIYKKYQSFAFTTSTSFKYNHDENVEFEALKYNPTWCGTGIHITCKENKDCTKDLNIYTN